MSLSWGLKRSILFFSVFMPWPLRCWILNKLVGYSVHPTSRIGIAWVFPENLIMEAYSYIGHLTACKGMTLLQLKTHASIGNANWISAYPIGAKGHYEKQVDRKAQLIIGEHSAVTSRHLIDCTNSILIGKYSTLAGYRTQILTHSIDLNKCRQWSAPIEIGDYCFIGTNSVILGGSRLPNYSVLGAKALLNKRYSQESFFYAGVPAKPIKKLSRKMKYFSRSDGYII